MLEVSRSGYYKWRDALPSERKEKRKTLEQKVRYHYQDTNGIYGSPKITDMIKKEGVPVSVRTISLIMRKLGLRSCTVKKFKVQTTDSNHNSPIAPNRLNQNFITIAPGKVWVADITYIRTREGMLYLACILDLFTRKIVGWRLQDRMTVELVREALKAAYKAKKPSPGLIHHSDRGTQYASKEYQELLSSYGMVSSMSRKGNCYDNACMESFYSLIKKELIYPNPLFKTKAEAKDRIFWYIELFYNRKRIHSSIGNMSPDRFEDQYYKGSLV